MDLQKERFDCSITEILEKINRDKVEVIYSPANIEEICDSFCKNGDKNISLQEKNDFLEMVENVTCCKEINPYVNGYDVIHKFCGNKGPSVVNEKPSSCFKRAFDNIKSNSFAERSQNHSTDISKGVSEHIKSEAEHLNFKEFTDKNPSILNYFRNLLAEKLIHKDAIYFIINSGMKIQPWNEKIQKIVVDKINEIACFKGDLYLNASDSLIENKDILSRGWDVCEAAIDSLMLIMIESGFSSEKVAKSSLHDVSHTIYGAYSDYFISRDPRLIRKAKSVYDFFGIKTKVLNGDNPEWKIHLN